MLTILLFIVFVYLGAAEAFTAFLYPNPDEVASYFKAAALPDWMFDLIIIVATVLTIASWSYLYLTAHGRTVRMPAWVEGLRIRLYLPFMNRLYADEMYQLLGNGIMRLVHQLDKRGTGLVAMKDERAHRHGCWPALPLVGAVGVSSSGRIRTDCKLSSIVWSVVSLGSVVGLSGLARDAPGRLLAALSAAADRDDLAIGTAGSRRPSPRRGS